MPTGLFLVRMAAAGRYRHRERAPLAAAVGAALAVGLPRPGPPPSTPPRDPGAGGGDVVRAAPARHGGLARRPRRPARHPALVRGRRDGRPLLRTAFASATVLVVTGVYQSWRGLGSWPALTETTYGRLLLAKLAGWPCCWPAAGGLHGGGRGGAVGGGGRLPVPSVQPAQPGQPGQPGRWVLPGPSGPPGRPGRWCGGLVERGGRGDGRAASAYVSGCRSRWADLRHGRRSGPEPMAPERGSSEPESSDPGRSEPGGTGSWVVRAGGTGSWVVRAGGTGSWVVRAGDVRAGAVGAWVVRAGAVGAGAVRVGAVRRRGRPASRAAPVRSGRGRRRGRRPVVTTVLTSTVPGRAADEAARAVPAGGVLPASVTTIPSTSAPPAGAPSRSPWTPVAPATTRCRPSSSAPTAAWPPYPNCASPSPSPTRGVGPIDAELGRPRRLLERQLPHLPSRHLDDEDDGPRVGDRPGRARRGGFGSSGDGQAKNRRCRRSTTPPRRTPVPPVTRARTPALPRTQYPYSRFARAGCLGPAAPDRPRPRIRRTPSAQTPQTAPHTPLTRNIGRMVSRSREGPPQLAREDGATGPAEDHGGQRVRHPGGHRRQQRLAHSRLGARRPESRPG